MNKNIQNSNAVTRMRMYRQALTRDSFMPYNMPKNTDFIDHCLMLHHRNTIFMIIYPPHIFLYIVTYLCTHYHNHATKINIHVITNIIINDKLKLK